MIFIKQFMLSTKLWTVELQLFNIIIDMCRLKKWICLETSDKPKHVGNICESWLTNTLKLHLTKQETYTPVIFISVF